MSTEDLTEPTLLEISGNLPGAWNARICVTDCPDSVLPSTLKRIVADGRATVRGWTKYKRQTGRLPWLSIAIHFLNWVVILSGGALLIWWGVREGLSKWEFTGVLLLVGVPYGIFWFWLSNTVKPYFFI